ncbi:hypothetical protein J5N97_025050 [Dioscorea zingiberensis]|uniref:Uncharacterized protein n=1 Tax=Dioscorea zingiberensis TaxID=325984 RepID=A0A9D5H9M7_9LILI|nr:hypothetical protein J5N97_025050 [Dioscorea zingiberensis]
MDFVEEESRPRFLFQSRASPLPSSNLQATKVSKLHAFICVFAAALLLAAAFYLSASQAVLPSLLFWASLSLLVGPFAPPSLTGGDVRVGVGSPVPDPDPIPDPSPDTKAQTRQPTRRTRAPTRDPAPIVLRSVVPEKKPPTAVPNGGQTEEVDWTDADLDLLKKQISKHPAGEPGRWDRIQEAFQGRHGVDSVIKMAKSLAERRPGDSDSYERFLKQRKPVDRRVEEEESMTGGWSSGEDLALLNALKAFPKDAVMRWEKVAAAVPGKSKAECVKRLAELKKDFRNSKAS